MLSVVACRGVEVHAPPAIEGVSFVLAVAEGDDLALTASEALPASFGFYRDEQEVWLLGYAEPLITHQIPAGEVPRGDRRPLPPAATTLRLDPSDGWVAAAQPFGGRPLLMGFDPSQCAQEDGGCALGDRCEMPCVVEAPSSTIAAVAPVVPSFPSSEGCPPGERAWGGACAPLDECPAGPFRDAPPGETVRYVVAGTAAGGSGTLADPYRTLAHAIATEAARPVTFLLGAGIFDETGATIPAEVRVVGRCIAETTIVVDDLAGAAVAHVTATPVVRVPAGPLVRLESVRAAEIVVEVGGSIDFDRLDAGELTVAGRATGAWLGAGTLDVSGLLEVTGAEVGPARTAGGELALTDVYFERIDADGRLTLAVARGERVSTTGGSAELRDVTACLLDVRDTDATVREVVAGHPENFAAAGFVGGSLELDGIRVETATNGVLLQEMQSAMLRRVFADVTTGSGINVDATPSVFLRDVDLRGGTGLSVEADATVDAAGVRIAATGELGVLLHPDGHLAMRRFLVDAPGVVVHVGVGNLGVPGEGSLRMSDGILRGQACFSLQKPIETELWDRVRYECLLDRDTLP